MRTYKNWRLEVDADNILWVKMDKDHASVNTISRPVMEELADIVKDIERDTTYKGVIITSAKDTGFIAGADIEEFRKFKDIEEATFVLSQGQLLFNKIEALKIPTVAMIDGFCLGGGMELALACRYRVVEESAKTRLGLPEVKLGIHPGWGGTVRLPRLIGAPQAMNLILSGHTISGRAAAKLGLADVAVPRRQLVHAARHYIQQRPPKHQPGFLQALTNQSFVRPLLGHFIMKNLRAKAKASQYPSPFDVVENWLQVGVDGQAAYDREAKTCGRLFLSETSANLVRLFFLQNRLKSLAKDTKFKPKHIHVIGAGTMGGDIAAWCALRGYKVTLQDLEYRFIANAIKRASNLFKSKLKETHLVQAAMDRLIPVVQGEADESIKMADLIIEAAKEDIKIKQDIFQQAERIAKPDAILATNTSSIPLDEINTVMKQPERLVGIHYFNPVAKMMLVEVVKGDKTSQAVVDKAMSFVRNIDRLPLPVRSSPGFLVNRILMPYLLEAIELVKSGVSMQAIDKAMKDFGMPMGPVTLADTVGLDVCLSVANHLGKYYNVPVPSQLEALVKAGKLGRKSGEGFYKYDKNGKQIKDAKDTSSSMPLTDVSNRLVLRMLDEAFKCLREGVTADGDLIDAGMVFGTGFAPFRGGPIHYAQTEGIDNLYQQYLRYRSENGETSQVEAWRVSEEMST